VRLIQADPSWPERLRRNKMDQWVILPLHSDKFPALTKLKEHIERLTFLQGQDPLTGLVNRRGFDSTMTLEVERSTRFKTPLTLCIMDLDNFKAVNDTYGHPCGDEVLQAVASILLSEMRMIDTAARIGGEEFALLLPGTGLARAQKLLQRIQSVIKATVSQLRSGQARRDHVHGRGKLSRQTPARSGKTPGRGGQGALSAKRAGKNRIEVAPIWTSSTAKTRPWFTRTKNDFFFPSSLLHLRTRNRTRTDMTEANKTLSIAVASGKGGVGKTNLALNLGFALHELGQTLVLLDADLGLANLDVLLGLSPEKNLQDLLGDATAENVVVPLAKEGFVFLPSASGVAELVELDEDVRTLLLGKLDALFRQYDFLLLDLGAGISPRCCRLRPCPRSGSWSSPPNPRP
jgi:diguanylate cyclase (GGDEF) domain